MARIAHGIISSVIMTLLSTVAFAAAGELDYIYDHYSTDNGLPHNSICDIHQDSKGFIWVSTWYGLSRFDGVSFVNFTMMPGKFSYGMHNRMLSIQEDVNGFLWLKTYDNRIARFDPVTEEFAAIPDELEPFRDIDSKVTAFHCDRDGNAWVAVSGYGVARFNPDLQVERTFRVGTESVGGNVTGIYEDSRGAVYVVSEAGIVAIRDDRTELISRAASIEAFCQYGSKVYISSGEEIIVVDTLQGLMPVIHQSDVTAITSTGNAAESALYFGVREGGIAVVDTIDMSLDFKSYDMGRVRYLFPDSGGLLWIATDRTGIFSYNPHSGRFRRYEHSPNVTSYYVDTLPRIIERAGMTWIKMNDYGFGWYDREKDEIVPMNNVKEQEDCRFMNGVPCFEVDSTGVLWMSTARRGLERVSLVTPSIGIIAPPSHSPENVASSEIRAILRDSRGDIYVASKTRELFRYNSDMTSCRRIPEDVGNIYSIFEDSDGNLWLGTKGDGLAKMVIRDDGSYTMQYFRHNPSDKFSISSDNIYSIEQDSAGKIWIGTWGGGLSMLESPQSDRFINAYNNFPNYPLDNSERVRYVHCAPDGEMLVSTVGALLICEPLDSPESMTFRQLKEVPMDDIIHIFSDGDGMTYFSTFGGGVYRLEVSRDGITVHEPIDVSGGLASNIVYSAIEDRYGDIWIATARGISKVERSSRTVTNYTRYDGIAPTTFSEATCGILADGSILFGSLDNVYRLDPDLFKTMPQTTRLAISGVSIDGKRVPMDSKVNVPHGYTFFRVDYASLDFRVTGGLNYSYQLKGYEKDWITGAAGQSVTYSRIPPGHYRFQVVVSSGDGRPGVETTGIDIRVRPSLWSSVASKLFFVIVALTLLLFVLRTVLTSMRLRNRIQVEKDLNDVKMKFFTNISHELRTPLTLILGGIDDIDKNTPKGDRNEYSVSLVHKNAKRMMLLVNQLLDIRSFASGKIRLRVSQIDIMDLLKQVYNDFRDMSSERQIEMRLTHSVDSLMIWGDRMRLEALIYNLLSNAFKYTADGGCIEAALLWREGDPEFSIMIKDNGIGVPKDKQKAIFEPFIKTSEATFNGVSSSGIGLSFCKDIADMHGGRIWVVSEKGKGSEFWVSLPVSRDHFSEETAEFIEINSPDENAGEGVGLSKYRVDPSYPKGAVKVLVVEDNAELRVYLYNNLVDRYEVKDVGNGLEALQVIKDGWIPDMIVTDLMMPQMDGIGLINHIRSDFSTSHIPIIMFTAKHENDTQLKAMRYGADGYIAKPFTIELLIARIENLFESRRRIVRNMAGTESDGKKVVITPAEAVITDRDEALIKKVHQWLEENIADSEITVDKLAEYVGMGRTSMYNKLKGLTGKSPVELIQDFRLEKAMYYLKSGQYSVSETSYKVGFSDPGYFSRSFKKHCGISPMDYIKEHKKS